jgi:hypothetical protein
MEKCIKHPKYKGKSLPKTQCICCANLYLKLHNKPRAPHKPTSSMKDKTKYTRKDKHKKTEV